MRRWRRSNWRFRQEQLAIEDWLALILRAARDGDSAIAREVAELSRLIKGYGETHARGNSSYERIIEEIVQPGLTSGSTKAGLAMRIKSARQAALADPDGNALGDALAKATDRTPKSSPA
jgi:indolepyruvate ferredoxin oxidoreductase beta subunit